MGCPSASEIVIRTFATCTLSLATTSMHLSPRETSWMTGVQVMREAVDEQGSTSPNKQQVNKQALLLLLSAAIKSERLGQKLSRFAAIGLALNHDVLHAQFRIAAHCRCDLLHGTC